ncbi:MAG: hypothetical protein ABI592_14930 [Acidobacteriota bacterium]
MTDRASRPSWQLVICYLPLFGVIPLLFKKTSREVRWHARNGLLLFGAMIAIGVLATLPGFFFPSFTCFYGFVMFFAGVVYVIVVILAIVKALQGERLIIPGLSRYANRR